MSDAVNSTAGANATRVVDAGAWRAAINPTPDERGRLVRLASRFSRNAHDAEDAVQSALLLAEQKRGQLREGDKRWAWMCRIVVQQCQLTHRQRQTRQGHEWSAGVERHAPRSDAPIIESAEFDALLERLVAALPLQQRTALVLRHFESMSYADIAAIMDVAESTARVHVRTAREALRAAIVEQHPEWSRGG